MPKLIEEFRSAGCLTDAVAAQHGLAGTLGSMDGKHDSKRGATIYLHDERVSERDAASAEKQEKAKKLAQRASERAAKAVEKRDEGKELGKKLAEDVKAALAVAEQAEQAEQAGQAEQAEVDGMEVDVDGGEIALSEDARRETVRSEVEKRKVAELKLILVHAFGRAQKEISALLQGPLRDLLTDAVLTAVASEG